ncbi:hypothetical protein LEP1GSC047_2816 [Leptospira inadai serovar Lyme str. 10]|uniref:Uncharacterized protein n=1 Tax=Leptospira inadai serovar Lyme str. 10 TaxID=1049790 RepID=V6HCH9_9LEPT|nr:hypothetical protein LEP1GSC047_2816 [Leptospira inadai serovar Lyme str. 10]
MGTLLVNVLSSVLCHLSSVSDPAMRYRIIFNFTIPVLLSD